MPFTSAATFSAFSLLWSITPILAPLAAIARAVAAPRPDPPPVMRTATSFNCIAGTFPWAFLLWTWRVSAGLSGRGSFLGCREDATADQRFHVLDILPANFVGDRADAGRARHRVPAEEQMIAGADQAGVEQHRIGGAELAAADALGEQAAMEIQQRR